jgi:hypothetical protein
MKIPKILFQCSSYKPPAYLVERIKSCSEGWEYKHFLEEDIIQFIKDHPIDEFKNSLEVFESISNGGHKLDFFKYYFLYINGGVFMDVDAIIEKNLDSIVQDYDFFAVNSALNNNSIFTGFIGSVSNNPIIYQSLKYISTENKDKINSDYSIVNKELYTIIENYQKFSNFIFSKSDESSKIIKNKNFIEEIVNEKNYAVTKDGDEVILTNYFNKINFIHSLKPIQFEKKDKIKIGVTLDLPKRSMEFFTNGIRQNVLYFVELLLNIGEYDVYFIVYDKNIAECQEYNQIFYREDFKIMKNSEIFSNPFDLIVVLGYDINKHIVNRLRYIGTKIVYYACGNTYLINTEKILYDQHEKMGDFNFLFKNESKLYDQIWSIPQMVNTNQYYWQTLYRAECIEVPFVWSNKSIKMAALSYGFKSEDEVLYSTKEGNTKKIAIFEPNISLMKWCLPALLVCENAYRINENNKSIERVFMNNIIDHSTSINKINMDFLNKIVKALDIFHDKKLSIEKRYNTLFFMKHYADIAVSHQMENPLNYLYLDLAWMGWPIVHNAHLCKDVGYYYEGFNYDMGGKILDEVIRNHDSNKEEYLIRNRKVIDRYLPSNVELQKKYKVLIDNLFSKNENKNEN